MATEAVWQGEYYSKHSDVQEKWHRAILSNVTWNGDESVLDLGCGDGRFTALYRSLVPRGKVLGIDSSESMIAWARHRHGEDLHLQFHVQDAMHLSDKNVFDCILSSNCLHWISDHRRVIHRIARALKTGGKFVLLFSSPDTPIRPIQQAISEAQSSARWRGYFARLEQTGFVFPNIYYEKWALEAGISHFSLSEIQTDDVFENLESFVSWIKGWLQPLSRLPASLHDLFAQEVGFRFLQHPAIQDAEGRVHFPQKLLLIKGEL